MARVLSEGGRWLSPEETEALLDCYGIPLVETVRVVTPEEAGRAAAELEREVALKAVVPGLVLTEGKGSL